MNGKEKIAVSACLLGQNCKYSGGSNFSQKVFDYVTDKEVLIFCPEVLGGLLVPREPCEIVADGMLKKVITPSGTDVTMAFVLGAQRSLELLRENNISHAVLKSRSPSCGCGKIYDGTFSKKLTDGNGITAELLLHHGIHVTTEDDL